MPDPSPYKEKINEKQPKIIMDEIFTFPIHPFKALERGPPGGGGGFGSTFVFFV